jgi:hypothetical protein
MEELVFRWVDRFGFPSAIVVVLIFAISRLYARNEKADEKLTSLQESTVGAIKENTDATKILTGELKKSLGSGPICKSGECKATEAGAAIVAELRKMDLGGGVSDKNILRVVEAVKSRNEKKPPEGATQ